jgi:hypothetical protein
MATLTLDRSWLNRLDTGEAISGYSDPDRQRRRGVEGEARRYAGGRIRSFSRAGLGGTFTFAFRLQTLATVEKLETWVAPVTVQYRDHRGQRFFGVFYEVPPVERKEIGWYDIPLTLHILTIAEGV